MISVVRLQCCSALNSYDPLPSSYYIFPCSLASRILNLIATTKRFVFPCKCSCHFHAFSRRRARVCGLRNTAQTNILEMLFKEGT